MKAGALTLVVATLLAGCTATPEPIATGVRPTSAPPPASSPASAGATATPTRATTAPTSTASTAARPVKVTLTVSADGPATVSYSDGWHTYATATRGGTTVVTFYTDADYVLAATVTGHAKTGERSCELDAGGRSHLASAGGAGGVALCHLVRTIDRPGPLPTAADDVQLRNLDAATQGTAWLGWSSPSLSGANEEVLRNRRQQVLLPRGVARLVVASTAAEDTVACSITDPAGRMYAREASSGAGAIATCVAQAQP